MVASKKLVYVQEKGQVTIPRAIRDELGLKKGDPVLVELKDGVVQIAPQTVIPDERLKRIEEEILASGITLEEMDAFIEEARNSRPVLMKELYGIDLED